MLKKIAAVLIAAGLVLPYGCEIRPITQLWSQDTANIFLFGLPVLGAAAYALHVLLPPIAQFHERNGASIHGVLRALIFMLFGGFTLTVLSDAPDGARGWTALVATAVVCVILLLFNQGRGTKAQRLPLLLLVMTSFFQILWFVTFVGEGLQYGGWIFSAGYAVAVWLEVKGLAATPKVMHGG
ncbi:MAG: hypothetical protein ACREN5_02785 [Gemmatimonadales bacterium]